MSDLPDDRPGLPAVRKLSRKEVARLNGARSRGPVTAEGKARSRLNGLVHGMRARQLRPVAALGETADALEAHVASVRREVGAVGPVGRHLAETMAGCMLRGARAERLEADFMAGLAAAQGSLAKALHDDRDARMALALLQRYRRAADEELRGALETFLRLAEARTLALVPQEGVAAAAEADLDQGLAAELLADATPAVEIPSAQQNDEAAAEAATAEPGFFDGQALLQHLRKLEREDADGAQGWWDALPLAAQDAALAAAKAAKKAAPG
jgi:hypothetical protein